MFQKYNSIENHYREKYIDSIRSAGFDKLEWVAREKIHGANLSFWPQEDGSVRVASRSGLTDDKFYGAKSVFDIMIPKIQHLGLVVYGELYGEGVQKGVNYGPKNFAAFDIIEGGQFVDDRRFIELCEQYEIPMAPLIKYGSFDELLEIDPSFPTKMSDSGDTAEGFVMKPVVSQLNEYGERVIVKKKSPEFMEKSSTKKVPVVAELSDDAMSLMTKAGQLVNMARVECAKSKDDTDNFGVILKAVIQDVYDELSKDEDMEHWPSIQKNISAEIAALIRQLLYGK